MIDCLTIINSNINRLMEIEEFQDERNSFQPSLPHGSNT